MKNHFLTPTVIFLYCFEYFIFILHCFLIAMIDKGGFVLYSGKT